MYLAGDPQRPLQTKRWGTVEGEFLIWSKSTCLPGTKVLAYWYKSACFTGWNAGVTGLRAGAAAEAEAGEGGGGHALGGGGALVHGLRRLGEGLRELRLTFGAKHRVARAVEKLVKEVELSLANAGGFTD